MKRVLVACLAVVVGCAHQAPPPVASTAPGYIDPTPDSTVLTTHNTAVRDNSGKFEEQAIVVDLPPYPQGPSCPDKTMFIARITKPVRGQTLEQTLAPYKPQQIFPYIRDGAREFLICTLLPK